MAVQAGHRMTILLVGVGGQGVLTAARMLGDAALAAGLEVMVGQLHGMAQRGGSVEGSVLIGAGQSAFIPRAGAEVVLGFEPLEVLRALSRISPRTKVVVNVEPVAPFSLAMRGEPYPTVDNLLDQVRQVAPDLLAIEGTTLLQQQLGNPRSLNIMLLGLLASLEILPFDSDLLWRAIERRSPPRFLETNQRAYEIGLHTATS